MQITATGKSLYVKGALSINPSSVNSTYTLNAGQGSINIAGTFPTWCSTTGTNTIQVSTGTISFAPAVTISSNKQNITFSNSGTINFNSSFTDDANELATSNNCIANFAGSYTVNTMAESWAGHGTAVFSSTGTITANANLTFNNFQTAASANLTLASASGTVLIAGAATLASGSTFTANQNFQLTGNWTNNGATMAGTNDTIIFVPNGGPGDTINGTSSTSFPVIQFGNSTSSQVNCFMKNSNTCKGVIFYSNNQNNTLTLLGTALTVNGDVNMNQPTGGQTNDLAISTGSCTISGNLNLPGTSSSGGQVAEVTVTSGSLSVTGNVNWGNNSHAANAVISVTTGTLTFNKSMTMASGTLTATGAGNINFNGGGGTRSLTFGGSNGPVFTIASGSAIDFADGMINNSNALTLGAGSTSTFTGAGTITANAPITFGNVQFNGADTIASTVNQVQIAGNITLASGSSLNALQNFQLAGNWTNNGGTLSGVDTLFLIAQGSVISGTASTTFPVVQLGNAASQKVSCTVNNSNTFGALVFYGTNQPDSLILGSATTLSITGNLTINQPTNGNTNVLMVNSGTCNLTGNLSFPGTSTGGNQIAQVAVTAGAFNISGNVTFASNNHAANAVISVSTGAVTFNNSLTMASGTLALTSAGTMNFKGTTVPSLNFGGTNAPVFTTSAGSSVSFAKGITNNTNALTFNAGCNNYFTGSGSITPNASITLGSVQLDSLAYDTIKVAAGSGIVGGSFTLLYGSNITATNGLEVWGNWTNNGGSTLGTNTIFMNGTGQTIGGTTSTTFPILQVGSATNSTSVVCTVNVNTTIDSLIFHAGSSSRTLTMPTGVTLTVNGNVNMNQPGGNVTNTLGVNGGTCIITGNFNFNGGSNGSEVAEVLVTTGTFTLEGNVNWMSNNSVSTEVFSVGSGTLNFAKSLSMGTKTGTINVTGGGTVNFNGTSAPSLTFGSNGGNAPAFTTAAGCTVNFKNGFTNNGSALSLNAHSTAVFSGSGSIIPNAAITFGNVQIDSSYKDTLQSGGAVIMAGNFSLGSGSLFYTEENFEVDGDWTNTSATLSGTTYTVFLNGASQAISGSPTAFQTLEIGNSTTAVSVDVTMACNNSCTGLIFHSGSKGRILALNSGATLSVSGNLTLNQPASNNMTNLLEVGPASCNVSGNLVFGSSSNSSSIVAKIDVTSGTFALTGGVTWGGSTTMADNVITVSTGTLTFGASISMPTRSGTIQVTGAGTINLNGTTAPSLNFGGSGSPVFNAASGSMVNFKNGVTAVTTPLALSTGSTARFFGSGTITPTAAISFGNIINSSGKTLTVAGNVSLTGNWSDSGTFVPSTYGVTFNGLGTQNISDNGGNESFYQLTVTAAGAVVTLLNNVTVTSALAMNGANINLNGNTLTLGSGSGASLNYVGGIAYGGTFKRWWPVTAITDSTGSAYGLFPIGTSTDYRYVKVNSTVNPTTAGYVSATHTNVSGITSESYTDNGGSLIVAIANMHSDLSTTALVGGTYNIKVHFTGFSPTGNTANEKLETYTGGVMGSVGTHLATIGPANTPSLQRTGLTASQLSNTWVCGTNDKNSTPLYAMYYSRKNANWSDTSAWSYTPGGGASCGCKPITGGYAVIDSSHTITANTSDSIQYMDILNDGAFVNNSLCNFAASGNVQAFGTGTFTNHGTATINGALIIEQGVSTSGGSLTLYDAFVLGAGGIFRQTSGTLTIGDEVIDSGSIILTGSSVLNITGVGTTINGAGSIIDSLGTIAISSNKTITQGSIIAFGTTTAKTSVSIASGTTLSNAGTVTIYGELYGLSSTATWLNNAYGSLSVTDTVMATGVLEVSTASNTVNYDGAGSQTIKAPFSSYYDLTASNGGTKTVSTSIQVDDALTIAGSAVVNEGTNVISGNAGINMSGISQLILQRNNEGVYPELSGIYNLTGGTVTIDQTGQDAIVAPAIYYNLTLNGTTPYDISGIYQINNNLLITNSATLSNNNSLIVAGILTDTSSGTIILSEDISVNGIALKRGIFEDDSNNITITGAGSWNMSGGSFVSTGQTMFYSKTAIPQTIGGSTPATFYDLMINNAGGVTLNLSPKAATQVSGYLDLTSGNLNTDSLNILEMLDTAIAINPSASSYVSGPMEKLGVSNFVFPVGKGGILGEAGISGMQNETTLVTAEYFNAEYPTRTPLASNLGQVGTKEYWLIERTVTSDSLQVQLFWTNAGVSNIVNCSYLTIAHYTGGTWINEIATASDSSVCSGTGSGSVQTTGYVHTFSPFTFGGDGGDALPVTLVTFNATPYKNTVLTTWVTATQINTAYFTVERSTDAEHFTGIGMLPAAGNSNEQLNYQFTDINPLTGVSYYRLRETDNNGNFTFSNVVAVDFNGETNFVLYPNPASGQVFINVTNAANEFLIKIFDLTGRQVYSKNYQGQLSNNSQPITIPVEQNLPAGMYLVDLLVDGNDYSEKLIVQ